MRYQYLLTFTVLIGCSQMETAPRVRMHSELVRDQLTGRNKVHTIPLNRDEIYRWYLEHNQILIGESYSCFKNAESTNYINIPEVDVDLIRTLITGERFELRARTVTYQGDDTTDFDSKIYEIRRVERINIEKKECIFDVDGDGKDEFVNSELYSYED